MYWFFRKSHLSLLCCSWQATSRGVEPTPPISSNVHHRPGDQNDTSDCGVIICTPSMSHTGIFQLVFFMVFTISRQVWIQSCVTSVVSLCYNMQIAWKSIGRDAFKSKARQHSFSLIRYILPFYHHCWPQSKNRRNTRTYSKVCVYYFHIIWSWPVKTYCCEFHLIIWQKHMRILIIGSYNSKGTTVLKFLDKPVQDFSHSSCPYL